MHIADVIKKPVLTEKSAKLIKELKQYSFYVDLKANKTHVKQAIEEMFDVKVERVNIMNVRAKDRKVGRYAGKTSRHRKAIVTLKEGYKITMLEFD